MPNVVIPEPAEGGASNATKIANNGDTIKFPHVDSCMGVVFFLSNGQAIGGHVPMQWDGNSDMDPGGNFTRITEQMQRLIPKDVAVIGARTLGDMSYGGMYGTDSLKNASHVDAEGPKGADIYVDVKTGKVRVVKCT